MNEDQISAARRSAETISPPLTGQEDKRSLAEIELQAIDNALSGWDPVIRGQTTLARVGGLLHEARKLHSIVHGAAEAAGCVPQQIAGEIQRLRQAAGEAVRCRPMPKAPRNDAASAEIFSAILHLTRIRADDLRNEVLGMVEQLAVVGHQVAGGPL